MSGPVGWMVQCADGATCLFDDIDAAREFADWAHGPRPVHPLYTRPEPLTDAQIEDLCWTELNHRLLGFARLVERAHGIGAMRDE